LTFEDYRVDTGLGEQLTEQETRGARADDGDLGSFW
jgi:hypothetical protein